MGYGFLVYTNRQKIQFGSKLILPWTYNLLDDLGLFTHSQA